MVSDNRSEEEKKAVENFPGKIVNDNFSIENVIQQFSLSNATLRRVMSLMLEEMEKGLKEDGKSSMKMLPSYVCALPNGSEKGNYLALDLGGTNFRVLLIRLMGDHKSEMKSRIYAIPQEIMTGTGVELFDHIADCLARFMQEAHLMNDNLDLGFTFSFPLLQEGLTNGKLISWTKGFKCSGVEGENVVQLLQEAAHRRKDINIDVVAVLNDTVGTLMSLAYTEPQCKMGIIVGTGTNACYVESMSKCAKLKKSSRHTEMVINTEWGAFGDNGCIDFLLTEFDRTIDSHSINPKKQTFEKLISGMYMGELVRVVLRYLTQRKLIFVGKYNEMLSVQNSIRTKDISSIESDALDGDTAFSKTISILNRNKIENVQRSDCEIVRKICAAVSSRSADLCAAGISLLLNRMHRPNVCVGVDGSMYRFHPCYKVLLEKKISVLVDQDLHFKLKLSEDGSGRGAALVAAVAHRMKK